MCLFSQMRRIVDSRTWRDVLVNVTVRLPSLFVRPVRWSRRYDTKSDFGKNNTDFPTKVTLLAPEYPLRCTEKERMAIPFTHVVLSIRDSERYCVR